MMHKKAVTPLISTVLLIMFAGSLGLLVMQWGQEAAQDIVGCGEINFDIVEFEGIKQACVKEETIEFTLENKGNIDIEGIRIIVFGSTDIEKINLVKSLAIGDAQKFMIGYGDIGNIEKIMFIPRINYLAEKMLCTDKSVEIIPGRCSD